MPLGFLGSSHGHREGLIEFEVDNPARMPSKCGTLVSRKRSRAGL